MKKLLMWLISGYQKYISTGLKNHCKYYPTCSEYTKQAIQKYGAGRGAIKGLARILRCNPLAKGGYDPLK